MDLGDYSVKSIEWVEFQIATSAMVNVPILCVVFFLNGIALHHNNANIHFDNCWSAAYPWCKS